MANILKNPVYSNKHGYSGFDMSQLHSFTSTVGELLPIYYDLLEPGDKVSIGTQLKTRTMELDSAAMMSVTEHLEWFFVPLEQIYHLFGSWFYGINDVDSSIYNVSQVRNSFPFIAGNIIKAIASINYYDDLVASNISFLLDPFVNNDNYNGVADSTEGGMTYKRLMDMLGLPISRMEQSKLTDDTALYPLAYNPMFACAYQKIYMDYYRLSDREASDSSYYSLDSMYQTSSSFDIVKAAKFFKLRYRPWKRDFFTSVSPSPLFGSSSVNSLPNQDLTKVHQWLNSQSTYRTVGPDGTGEVSVPTSVGPYMTQVNVLNVTSAMSTASIRTSFAIEKLLRITRQAGKHYDKQTLAHYGVDVPQGISGEVFFLGGTESKLQIGDVIATAASETNALGQVGGKGYGYGEGSRINFTASCHGILMGIYSAEPDVDYTSSGVDKLTTLINREDWYQPEYDDLGQQPLFAYQGRMTQPEDWTNYTNILGWHWRYMERKMKYNIVHGGLQHQLGLGYWKPQRVGFHYNTLSSFLVNPLYLNPVMAVSYAPDNTIADGRLLGLYHTDPLLHELYIDCKKSSKMSTYGVPNL